MCINHHVLKSTSQEDLVCIPGDTVLKSDNVVEIFGGKKGEALQFFTDCVQSLAHSHRVHLGLVGRESYREKQNCPF